jgi:predicted transcriptional regulator
MNNFNKIFEIVKEKCRESESDSISGIDQYRKIAGEAGISLERLHFYLECIEHIGVIKYSPESRAITVTSKGKEAIVVFP